MITTLVFFDAGALISRAAEQIVTNVHFIVPEIIYLKPDINSKTSSTIGEFQWYVGSTVNTATFEETLSTGENPTGSVYFEYTAASSVDISFKFIDDNLNDYTSLPEQSGIVINGTRILPQGNSSQNNTIHSIGSNFNGQILSGYSPALNPYEKGCYIEWTASFTDSTDGIDKSVKAYTYVYKPYIQQAGVALKSVNGTSSRRLYAQNTAWISGINGLLEAGNYCPNQKCL